MKITKIFSLILVLLATIVLSACTDKKKVDLLVERGNDPQKVKLYREHMKHVVKDIEDNEPNYVHLPLTEKSDFDWFHIQCYALLNKNITKEQFIQTGAQRYPDHHESIVYLALQLTQ